MQTSSKKFIFFRGIFLFISVTMFIGFVLWGLQIQELGTIKVNIEPMKSNFDSNQFSTVKSEILSDLRFKKGQSLWDLDIAQIITEIKKKEWVEDVQLTRLFPNRLNVALDLKKITVAYVDDAGIWMPVGNDGTLLNKSAGSGLPDMPYLRGRKFYENKNLRLQAIGLVQSLPSAGVLNQQAVSEIFYESKTGFEMLLSKSGTRVVLGVDNFDLKVKRVNKVLEYLEAKEIIGRVIDARYEKKILVRMRKGS